MSVKASLKIMLLANETVVAEVEDQNSGSASSRRLIPVPQLMLKTVHPKPVGGERWIRVLAQMSAPLRMTLSGSLQTSSV